MPSMIPSVAAGMLRAVCLGASAMGACKAYDHNHPDGVQALHEADAPDATDGERLGVGPRS